MHCQGSEFKQTTFKPQITQVFSQLFYSLSIMFSFEKSFDKAPSLLLIFVCVAEGHAHFQLEILHYS